MDSMTGKECETKAAEVVRLLDGMTLSDALYVLRKAAPDLLLNLHQVDVGSPRFAEAESRRLLDSGCNAASLIGAEPGGHRAKVL